MSRPAKPIQTATGARTNEELTARRETEARLKGNEPVKVPSYLSPSQKKIAKSIIDGLSQAEILSSLDDTIIALAAFSIDGIISCILAQAEDNEIMDDSNFRQKLKKYEETFEKACRELGLSPQARAKIAICAQSPKDNSADILKSIIAGDKK